MAAAAARSKMKLVIQESVVQESLSSQALQKVDKNFSVELAPFGELAKALAFKTDAQAILASGITDKESHQHALTTMREGKGLQRATKEHWGRVIRWLEERQRDIRTIQAMDLELVEPGIFGLSQAALVYENTEKERARIAQEIQRRLDEEIAQRRRQEELVGLEQQALKAEAISGELSEREQRFVEFVFHGTAPVSAAERCGFKDPARQAMRLMETMKIQVTLDGKRQAQAILEQRAALEVKPLQVKTTTITANVAKVAGIRTVQTKTGEAVDAAACVAHLLAGGEDAPPADLFMVNQVKLNSYARSLGAEIERWHGIRFILTETKAG